MLSAILEAKQLHSYGFGIHWIRPNSKIPVKSGWSNNQRDPLTMLLAEHQAGFNVGTKLGTPSKVKNGYLAVIDVDVKGTLPKHRAQALAKIEELFPGMLTDAPVTLSGRGNGSMHVWFLVPTPLQSRNVFASNEQVTVHMPSAKATTQQIKILGEQKVAEGFRLRPAFEVDFMCEGRQVVLPPSIHPDTGKVYKWKNGEFNLKDLSFYKMQEFFSTFKSAKKLSATPGDTKVTVVDIDELDLLKLPLKIQSAIYNGDGVHDRSASCLAICMSMIHARFNEAEILGVLTKRDFFIGDVAYEHAKTTNRLRAAYWAKKYCYDKAFLEVSSTNDFSTDFEEFETLSNSETLAQVERITKNKAEVKDWRKFLDRSTTDNLKPSLKNTVLILENAIGKDICKRNLFSMTDHFGTSTPWGANKGEALTDEDFISAKLWLAHTWKIEPNVNLVLEAMTNIATRNAYHPVREFLTSTCWDGVPRINTWLKDYLGAEGVEPYLSNVSRKFLVACVARVFDPGVKFDYMLILEGKQGIGKSTMGAIMATNKWFLDSLPDLHDKDAALNLRGNWFVEMGELASLKRADVETVKSFITRQIDKVRPPYGKKYIECARQCVFFGSTNADDYLKDKTGNRRFWPVKVHDVDFESLKRDRSQLWAEALFIYDLGEILYLKDDALAQSLDVQASRVLEDESDVMFETLKLWLEVVIKRKKQLSGKRSITLKFRIKDLFSGFNSDEELENLAPPFKDQKEANYQFQIASNCLRKLGFRKACIHGYNFWVKTLEKGDENFDEN